LARGRPVIMAGNYAISKEDLITLMDNEAMDDAIAEGKHPPIVEQLGDIKGICSKLKTDQTKGLDSDPVDIVNRMEVYGGNFFDEETPASYWELMLAAVDEIIILLLVLATLTLTLEMIFSTPEKRKMAWAEPFAIYMSVIIILNVSASSEYRQNALLRELQARLDTSNKKKIFRSGEMLEVADREIVVGDLVAFNSHDCAVIPADGILLPGGHDVKIDESTLTGEPEFRDKSVGGDFLLLSGTICKQGNGKMVVVAVGKSTKGGRIKEAVYGVGSGDSEKSVRMTNTHGGAVFLTTDNGADAKSIATIQINQEVQVFGHETVTNMNGEEVEWYKVAVDKKPGDDTERFGWILASETEDVATAEENLSPLVMKLNILVVQISRVGYFFGIGVFFLMSILGIAKAGFTDFEWMHLTEYLITSITVLAVAIPEGLPLAQVLSLAYSSSRMMKEGNLVRTLSSCETMGSATTICTDKTGTLTQNKMTVMSMWAGEGSIGEDPDDAGKGWKSGMIHAKDTSLGSLAKPKLNAEVSSLLGDCISVCSMNETAFKRVQQKSNPIEFIGNPTECSLLVLADDLGHNYEKVRQATVGRNEKTQDQGRPRLFASTRKMMSWAVPTPGAEGASPKGTRKKSDDDEDEEKESDDEEAEEAEEEEEAEDAQPMTIYAKGASEIILDRCDYYLRPGGSEDEPLDERPELTPEIKQWLLKNVIGALANEAKRTIALAYKEDREYVHGELHDEIENADGSMAFASETGLTLIGIVGIEDPLRDDVPDAIAKCYGAGIDVRMVTGDNLQTAIAIAKQAKILDESNPSQFKTVDGKKVLKNQYVAMEGPRFRAKVYIQGQAKEGEEAPEPIFNAKEFDKIWPHLRVLARSSPEDKLTLANGLRKSQLYQDTAACDKLEKEGITIFPDRQVVAMTGDGTNDAPALKAADVGFAMGISGTQIAKDAADIILLEDSFADIVTAAKWGRNVFDSISKFVQFQLTVNIVALFVATLGAAVWQESPLAAVQLLWVNLIMDALASLALATEPPNEEVQLKRPPVNLHDSIITRQMLANMCGQAVYQIIVVCWILFDYDFWGYDENGHDWSVENDGLPSEHYTFVFNTFVFMQLFNEINSRKLFGEKNVFAGLLSNYMFIGILVSTTIFQILCVQFFGRFVRCSDGGLGMEHWGYCVAFGAFSLVWQQILNVLQMIFKGFNLGARGNVKNGKRGTMIGSGSIHTVPKGLSNTNLQRQTSTGQANQMPSGSLQRRPSAGRV